MVIKRNVQLTATYKNMSKNYLSKPNIGTDQICHLNESSNQYVFCYIRL